MMEKWRTWGIAAVLAAGVSGVAFCAWRQPEITPAMRGEEVARRAGCFACHGPGGLGGVPDPDSSASTVAGWDPGTAAMYVKSEQEISEWILYGAPRDRDPQPDSQASQALFTMPAYEAWLSEEEVTDLVAYFKAVSGWGPSIPERAYEGRKVAERLGCFGCHGHSGMGGMPNPGSLKGQIPPWDGEAFGDLVRDEGELREWILEGKIGRLWGNPWARHFLDGQIIQMPAYAEFLSGDELEKLLTYIRWLRER
jgi:mono/diheme cytochrome c family protein